MNFCDICNKEKQDVKEYRYNEGGETPGKIYICNDCHNEDYDGIGVTSQFYFCALPLRLDTYKGCLHGCKYCFANARRRNYKGNDGYGALTHINLIENKLKNAGGYEGKNIIMNCIRHQLPFHWGGMSDPFMQFENRYRLSLQIADLLYNYNYPCVISTKGKSLLKPEYFNIFSKLRTQIQLSLFSDNPSVIKHFEPNAASLEERIQIARQYNEIGIPVSFRLQPLIYSEIDIDNYIEICNKAKVNYVTIEHLKIPIDNPELVKDINTELGYDIVKRYHKISGGINAPKIYGREFELAGNIKLLLLKKYRILAKFKEANINVGMGDNQLHHLNHGKCCCGVDTLTNFNIFEAQYTAMFKRKNDNYTFNDLVGGQWIPNGRVALNSNTINSLPYGYQPVIYDLLRYKWNNPSTNDSPSDTHKLVPVKNDGDTSYKWDTTTQKTLFT